MTSPSTSCTASRPARTGSPPSGARHRPRSSTSHSAAACACSWWGIHPARSCKQAVPPTSASRPDPDQDPGSPSLEASEACPSGGRRPAGSCEGPPRIAALRHEALDTRLGPPLACRSPETASGARPRSRRPLGDDGHVAARTASRRPRQSVGSSAAGRESGQRVLRVRHGGPELRARIRLLASLTASAKEARARAGGRRPPAPRPPARRASTAPAGESSGCTRCRRSGTPPWRGCRPAA